MEGVAIDKLILTEIIEKAQSGDKEAFEYILNKYKPLVIKNALQIYISGYQVDDLIQIGSIALVNAVYKYDCSKPAGFMAYAKIAIKNSLNDELRRVLSKNTDEKFKCSLNKVNEDGIEFIEFLASDIDVEAEILLKEEIHVLRKALAILLPKEREIIDWFYLKQRTLKEYSDIKGLKKATVIKRKSRALEKLKKYFFELINNIGGV